MSSNDRAEPTSTPHRSSTPAPWPSDPGGPRYTETDLEALFAEMHGDH